MPNQRITDDRSSVKDPSIFYILSGNGTNYIEQFHADRREEVNTFAYLILFVFSATEPVLVSLEVDDTIVKLILWRGRILHGYAILW
jgi:hypothetical protein